MAPSTRTLLFALIGLTALGAAAFYIKTEILDKEKEGTYDSEDEDDDDDDDDDNGEEDVEQIDGGPSITDTAKSRETMFSSISEANKNQNQQESGEATGREENDMDTLEPPDNSKSEKKKKKKKSVEEKKKDEEAEIAEKERLYDDTCNAAKKALQGNDYALAAEKYSQAIDLAQNLPSASKDILPMYNNRSAMYERAGKFDEALNDITVVLAVDVKHMKGRARRARILEAQGKLNDAIDELVLLMSLEQIEGKMPTCHDKIDELNKILSTKGADEIIEKVKEGTGRGLPTKSYCRTFLETFPSIHVYRKRLQDMTTDSLLAAFESAVGFQDKLSALLNCTWGTILKSNISESFKTLEKFHNENLSDIKANSVASGAMANKLSSFFDVLGTFYHLSCNFKEAVESYKKSIALNGDNIESAIKLAQVYIELGENDTAENIFDSLCTTQKEVNLAWSLTHQASLFISRNKDGSYREGGVTKATEAVERALELTSGFESMNAEDGTQESAKSARLNACMKTIQITTQSKPLCGIEPTEEDHQQAISLVETMKNLYPKNQMVVLLEADSRNSSGDFEGALALCDECANGSDGTDGFPYVMKANIYQGQFLQFMEQMQQGNMAVRDQLVHSKETIEENFRKALESEPNMVEAYTRLAQFYTMLGQPDEALKLLDQGVEHVRYRDEAIETLNLRTITSAQAKANAFIMTNCPPAYPGM